MNNPESYHALVLGDLHYNRPGCQGGEPENESQKRWRKLSLDMWSGKSRSLLKDAAGRLERGDFPLVLQTGDLIQGDCIDSARQSGMFRDAIQTVKQYTGAERRFLPVVGNHDLLLQDSASRTPGYDGQGRCVRPFSGEYEAVRDVLMPFIAEEAGLETVPEDANYAVRQGPDLFLFVDPFRAGMKEFIERTLDAVPDTRYVFAVSHLALLPCDPDRALVRWLMPDPAETAALLASRNAVVLTGHTHWFHFVRYRHPEGVIAQLAVSSLGTNWPLTAPLHCAMRDYGDYSGEMSPLLTGPERVFPPENYLEHRSWCGKVDGKHTGAGGYAVLNIGPEGVSAEIYTGKNNAELVLRAA